MSKNKEISNDPTSKEIKFILELVNLNKTSEAEKELTKKLAEYPNSSILYNILGGVLVNKDDMNNAIVNFEKSIKINPNYAQAYNNLGIVFHKINKTDIAIEKYKKALSLKKDFVEVLVCINSTVS